MGLMDLTKLRVTKERCESPNSLKTRLLKCHKVLLTEKNLVTSRILLSLPLGQNKEVKNGKIASLNEHVSVFEISTETATRVLRYSMDIDQD